MFVLLAAPVARGQEAPQGAAAASEQGTLDEALIAAYSTNPSLKAARAAARIVDEGEAAAWSNLRPQISGTASFEQTHLNRESPFQSLNSQRELDLGSVYAGFTVQQPLFQGLRNVNAVRKAKADEKAERARLTDAEQKLLLATLEAYLDVRTESAVVFLNQGNINVLSTALDVARGRFALQAATRTDVAQAEARLAKARADLVNARARLEAAKARYREMTSAEPFATLAPPRPLALPDTEEEAQTAAADHAPSAVAAQATEEASRRAVGVAKGELAPKIVAEAGYTYAQDQTFEGDRARSYYAGVRATVPFYDGGLTHAKVRQAKQTLQRDEYLTADTLRALQTDVREAFVAKEAALAAKRAAEAEVAADEVAAEGVSKENAAGRRTTLDVLNAQQELLSARTAELRAERDAYLAGAKLLATMGQFTVRAIGLDVDRYDPDRHKKRATLGAFGLSASRGGDAKPKKHDLPPPPPLRDLTAADFEAAKK